MKTLTISFITALSLVAGLPAVAGATLTDAQRDAALWALDDEYKAWAHYEFVMEKFGRQKPFTNIQKAEARHIEAVIEVLKADGTPISPNPYLDGTHPRPDLPDSLSQACAAGVQAEIDNYTLYDEKLLPIAASNTELSRVFTGLRDASEFKHLPAFERCAAR
ncbi:MAG: ferritin-like domain-containing protein [Planktomarina sp.]